MTQSIETEWKTVTKSDKKRLARNKNRTKKNSQKDEGWVVHSSLLQTTVVSAISTNESSTTTMSQEELHKVSSQCQLHLQSSKFFSQLQDRLLMTTPPPTSLVCYGIGNFGRQQTTPSASMWQLACVLELRNVWKQQGKDIPLYYFDPIMTMEEAVFLKTISIQVMLENDQGRRSVEDSPTFFFMPHCPLALYSNLLFTNLQTLYHLIILGNSLTAYAHRLAQNCHTKLLQHLEPLWEESPIELPPPDELQSLPGQFEQGFNDTSIIYFRKSANDSKVRIPNELFDELLHHHDESGEVI